MGPLLNGIETAAALGIDPKTLRNQMKAGRPLVAPIAGSRPPRWRKCDVEAVIGRPV